ncbi:MAG: hypothetical protein K2O45_11805 [Oscillospiraceae bacterium]|nr:hypothetical protein [Oscillospiraceae bacterium]
MAAALLLLFVGAALLTYSFMQLLAPDEEWVEVQAGSTGGPNVGSEFSFLYRPGSGELSYSADLKAVTALYTQLCRDAYLLFHNEEAAEGVCNLYEINRHPNEILEIDDGFYEAFAAVERTGSRAIYLGPVYDRYESVFFCEDDSQLADFDPRLSPEVAQEYREVARFANDSNSIQVELLGEGRIRLAVSEEYLAYAQREEIDDFIDFAWMRNAFIADFLARGLEAGGYTCGALSSYDGFIRNLDGSGQSYSLNLYDLRDETVYGAAVMNYQGPMSIVSLRDYPASGLDQYRFYRLGNGEMRTPYLDPADGLCRNALHHLTGYAGDRGCGEVLLALLPVYIADQFRPEELARLARTGINSVYCQDRVIWHTDPALELDRLYELDGVRYTEALLES